MWDSSVLNRIQATVEKEQGIIGQEIDMYKDVPDWEVMFNCLRNMYHNLPVRWQESL